MYHCMNPDRVVLGSENVAAMDIVEQLICPSNTGPQTNSAHGGDV